MNLVIRRNRVPHKLFSIELRNRVTSGTILATFYEPQKERKYIKDNRSWTVVWKARVRIARDKKVLRDSSLPGVSWLSSLMLAIESLRILIPVEEEDDWVNESDFPSWLLLPKTIDVSWGRELHGELVDIVNMRLAKFISNVDKKRRKYEERKKS